MKDYSYREKIKKLVLTTLQERKMRSDVNKTFEIINRISNCGRHFFKISPRIGNLQSRRISKTKFTYIWIFLQIEQYILETKSDQKQ